MILFEFLKRKLFFRQHKVHFAGKDIKLYCRRFQKLTESPQEFIDQHGVICGNCGTIILPDDEVWFKVASPDDLKQPGVLKLDIEGKSVLVCCLAFNCVGSAAFMCGRLERYRRIEFFESPMQKMLRTGEVVIVPNIKTYRG